MTKRQVAFLAAVGVMAAVFGYAQTGGSVCIQENGINKGCVPYINFQGDTAAWVNKSVAFIGISDAGVSFARFAADAGYATNAGNANTANTATYAYDAGQAAYAVDAEYANTAGSAGSAGTCGTATYALDAGQANYAPQAGNAATAGTATYALDAGYAVTSGSAGSAGTCGTCTSAGTATYAADAGNVVCTGCILGGLIATGAITKLKIGLGEIDHTRVADGGILGNNIIPGGIGTPQLASMAVTNANLGPNAVTSDKIDAGAITETLLATGAVSAAKLQDTAVTKVYRGTSVTNVTDLYNFQSDTLDLVKDGATFGRPALPSLDGGYIIQVKRGGSTVPTETLFKKANAADPDTLDSVVDGTTFARISKANVDGGAVLLDSTLEGTFGKTRVAGLTGGYVSTLSRGGSTYATSTFLNSGLDTLDTLGDGTTFARVAKAKLDGGSVVLDLTLDGTYSKTLAAGVSSGYVSTLSRGGSTYATSTFLNSGLDTQDNLADGTSFARPLKASLDGGYVITVKRGGSTVPTETLFKKASAADPDTLDSVPDGTGYRRVNYNFIDTSGRITGVLNPVTYGLTTTADLFIKTLDTLNEVPDGTTFARTAKASLDGGYVVTVKRGGVSESVDNLFKKSSDTFASVAGTLSDGQLGSNVVNTSNIKDGQVTTLKVADGNITTAKVADLGITADKLNDGIALSAYDEETVAGISSRTTATNCTKGSYDGATGYIRLTLAAGSTNPQLSTGLYTGTATNVRTTHAVMRYRISGGASGAVTKMQAFNTADVAQKASAAFLADGAWHTATFDISGWTTAGTLRVDLTTTALGTTGYWDVAYLATGVAGSGTGALISNAGNVGIGTASPRTALHAYGTSNTPSASGSTEKGIFIVEGSATNAIKMGTDPSSPYGVWIQGLDKTNNTTQYPLLLNPVGGNVGIGTGSPGEQLDLGGYAHLRAATGNSYGYLSHQYFSSNGYDYFTLSSNFKRTSATGGTVPASTIGTAAIDLMTGGSNVGAVTFSTGATNTAPTEKVRIDSSGNVGIGTASPAAKLSVSTGDSRKQFTVDLSADPVVKIGTPDWYNIGEVAFVTGSGGERMRISSGGNVGIGISSNDSDARLQVKGGATRIQNFGGTPSAPTEVLDWPYAALNVATYGDFGLQTALAFTLPNDGNYDTGFATWNFKLAQTASSKTSAGVAGMQFGGPGYLSLQPSGNVAIGVAAAGEEKLEVRTGTGYGLLHSNGTQKVGTYVDTTGGWVGTKSNHDLKLFSNNGVARVTITSGGETRVISLAGGGTRGVSTDNNGALIPDPSDANLKTAVEDLRNPLRMVLNMRPVSFNWKDADRFGGQREVGFLAQEMMGVVPEAVSVNSGGTYSLDYAKLVAVLAGAVQELYADRTALAERVQLLEDRAKAAEDKLAQLEARLSSLENYSGIKGCGDCPQTP